MALSWTDSQAILVQRLYPRDGYPFTLDLQIEYTLSDAGLTVATTATNIGPGPLPFGAGYHPYLTVGTPLINGATLQLPASTYLETDERLIPTGQTSVEGTDFDFREERRIGDVKLDTCFTNVIPDPDGHARVTLTNPEDGFAITVWMDESHGFIQAFTGDALPEADQRRAIAIEPMTCAPNAFNTGAGLRVIQPGESFTSAWGISTR